MTVKKAPASSGKLPKAPRSEPKMRDENMASGKALTGEALPGEVVINALLSEIDFRSDFNTRSTGTGFVAQKTAEGGETEDEESNSYSKNFLSIALKGQDTPIIIRHNPDKTSKKPYACVTGFTRGAIIAELASLDMSDAKLAGVEKSALVNRSEPTIKAIVREMSDDDAFELNVRENTARKNPNPPDLAWGIYRIKTSNGAVSAKDSTRTDQSIADGIGVSQPYVSRLMRIMGNFDDQVLTHWRHAANNGSIQLDVMTMYGLLEVDAKDRTAAYFEACKAKEVREEEGQQGQNRWIDTAADKAEAMGALLGALVREGHIECDTPAEEMIKILVPLKRKDIKDSHWNKFAKRCEKAFAKAVKEPTLEERAAIAADEAEAAEALAAAAGKGGAGKGGAGKGGAGKGGKGGKGVNGRSASAAS